MALYLVHDILERVRAVNGEADKYEVGLGVGERAEAVVLLLAGRVPEGQLDRLASWGVGGVGDVVLENGRDVFLEVVAVSVCGPGVLETWGGGMQCAPRESIPGCS